YRSFQDVADFREELDRLEHDLPGEGQLSLLAGERAGTESTDRGRRR
ncbi:MAG: transcriptional regulator NrdR, partial [Pseudomonadota bacterium]|nr:transcriptional regulator NrdR [Pseudomonadota bacterium]